MYKAMIKKSKNKKGFTLVELIVVMAILAILAAILIPAVGGMIRRSNQAVDDATARNLYMAGTMVLAFEGEDATDIMNHQEFENFMGQTGSPTSKVTGGNDFTVTNEGGEIEIGLVDGEDDYTWYPTTGSFDWDGSTTK